MVQSKYLVLFVALALGFTAVTALPRATKDPVSCSSETGTTACLPNDSAETLINDQLQKPKAAVGDESGKPFDSLSGEKPTADRVPSRVESTRSKLKRLGKKALENVDVSHNGIYLKYHGYPVFGFNTKGTPVLAGVELGGLNPSSKRSQAKSGEPILASALKSKGSNSRSKPRLPQSRPKSRVAKPTNRRSGKV
ncbi:hypothetical protein IWQ62_003949 [Dispira parvispora]|uniref:Uncharacterized protein n=1 Tax=Dispira parvispora TaxID=1520584 RepID=A0A9W8ATW4_9FUNG|nr:hypothetical protein IWQ62_003949 [Dispira parvispora]